MRRWRSEVIYIRACAYVDALHMSASCRPSLSIYIRMATQTPFDDSGLELIFMPSTLWTFGGRMHACILSAADP